MQQMLSLADSSFKYILLTFNLMTLVVVYLHKKKQKLLKQHNILFITAHPDDQVMFFRPTLKSVTNQYFVHLLCLTGGQTQRQNQLKESAKKLNLHKVLCIKNQRIPDSMVQEWPKQQIKSIIMQYIQQNNIKAIFTFDQYGISNHINHKSIYNALSELHYPKNQLKILNKKENYLTQLQKQKIKQIKNDSIKIYHLKSVNLLRKYSGFLQILIALVKDFSWININVVDAYRSMAVHKSQFVWFRKLWVFFSQYSYINIYIMTRVKININLQKQNNNNENGQNKTLSQEQKQNTSSKSKNQ